MKICIFNVYHVKPGMRQMLIDEMNEAKMESRFQVQPGVVAFKYSAPLDDADEIYVTDIWKDEESFKAHLHCEAVPKWYELKEKYITQMDTIALQCEDYDL